MSQGQLIINTSTISDNYAFDLFDNGPAPVSEIKNDGVLELRNVSLGGDIDNEGTARLGNTLIAGGCTGTLESLSHNLIADVTGCLLTGGSSGDLTDTAPVFGRLQNIRRSVAFRLK